MASTDLVLANDLADRFPLLSADDEMREAMEENMDGDEIGLFDLPRVIIPAGGSTTWEVDDEPTKELKGVIVWIGKNRSFWVSKRGEGGGDGPPDCASDDAKFGRGLYGVGSANHPTGDCTTCPMNQWVDDGQGKKRKPCKEQRRLVMMLEENPLPVVIQLPPTSIGVLRKQLLMKLTAKGIPYHEALITLKLKKIDSAANPYSVIDPTITGRLDKASAAVLKQVGDNIKNAYEAQSA